MGLMDWYSSVLARRPYVVMACVVLVWAVSLTILVLRYPLPDFSDPRKGFETRGTSLSRRMVAWTNLADSVGVSGPLVTDPAQDPQSPYFRRPSDRHHAQDDLPEVARAEDAEQRQEVMDDENVWTLPTDSSQQWFCGPLQPVYGRLVFEPASDRRADLFSVPAVLSMCRLERLYLTDQPEFRQACQRRAGSQHCCRSWSLPSYLALLGNRSSCSELRPDDISAGRRLLRRCAGFYHSGRLQQGCDEDATRCPSVPAECVRHDAVYNLLHYILDGDFGRSVPAVEKSDALPPRTASKVSLAASFLPLAFAGALLPYISSVPNPLADNVTRLAGLGFDVKGALFDQFLKSDAVYLLAACLLIAALTCIYTGSVTITVSTLFAVQMALTLAYFVYTVVLRLAFFPFMNVLAIVIAVAVGADDAFILCSIWRRHTAKSDDHDDAGDADLTQIVRRTLTHAAPGMLLTSATTAAAFFATSVSRVTAIACFGVFAGLTIVFNAALMLSWVAASVVVSRRCSWPCARYCGVQWRRVGGAAAQHALLSVVVRLRWVWTVSLGAAAIAAVLVLWRYPGLRLPDGRHFRLLRPTHPIERYDQQLARRFRFERVGGDDEATASASSSSAAGENGTSDAQATYHLVMSFVWGVQALDNGDMFNPDDRGSLQLDSGFNLSSPAAQQWMHDFCVRVRSQPFYGSTRGPLLANCAVETLRRWMHRRPCVDPTDGRSRMPCCRRSTFPYQPPVFERCLREAVHRVVRTPHIFGGASSVAGAYFSGGAAGSHLAAVVVEYNSRQPYTLAHRPMAEFVAAVDAWLQRQLATAPAGLQRAWLLTDVEMLDLQRQLASGTWQAAAAAVGLTAVLLLIVSGLDVRLSALAAVTVACVICVSVGSLVLLNWRLNVLESAAVTVAVGLSVDYTLHLCAAYRLYFTADASPDHWHRSSPDADQCRVDGVASAISAVAIPVSMAAVTTALAGACMLPSLVMAYVQMGVFLLVLSAVSWTYSTLFFLSLLCICGPTGVCDAPSAICRRREEVVVAPAAAAEDEAAGVCDVSAISNEDVVDCTTLNPPPSPIIRLATGRGIHLSRRREHVHL